MKTVRRLLLSALVGALVITLLGAAALVIWATVSAQPATERAVTILAENGVQRADGWLVFAPDTPTTTGFIYYPGALVEPEAYAGTAQGVADAGYLAAIPKMPLNLAFFDANAAAELRAAHPEIDTWVIGGHSLGGALAADYAQEHQTDLAGLIMLASYPGESDDFINFPLPILSIVGANDPGAPNQRAFYDAIADTTAADLVIIDGANHRQYGDYAYQPNDGVAAISAAAQQAQIVTAIVGFLDRVD